MAYDEGRIAYLKVLCVGSLELLAMGFERPVQRKLREAGGFFFFFLRKLEARLHARPFFLFFDPARQSMYKNSIG